MEVARIEPGALPEGTDDPVVLLVKSASGDEEVGAAGANLRGVLLCHSLPHLSHLGAPLHPVLAELHLHEGSCCRRMERAIRHPEGSMPCLC